MLCLNFYAFQNISENVFIIMEWLICSRCKSSEAVYVIAANDIYEIFGDIYE